MFSKTNTQSDPLAHFEKKHSGGKSFKKGMKFLFHYTLLTSMVFCVLLFLTNFSAYKNRIVYWVNPSVLSEEEHKIDSILSASSMEVHAESYSDEKEETLDILTEKIAEKHPEIIFGNQGDPSRLLTHIESDEQSIRFDITPYENRIIIPKLGKNIPLVDVNVGENFDFDHMENIFMKELQKGVVRYPGTARPGEEGNAFIFGHSSNYPWVQSEYNDVFSLLDTLTEEDEIIVYYKQQKYTYRVTEKKIIKPGDVKAMEGRDPTKKELSLMTCWPIGTTLNRMIVFTELVSDNHIEDTGMAFSSPTP